MMGVPLAPRRSLISRSTRNIYLFCILFIFFSAIFLHTTPTRIKIYDGDKSFKGDPEVNVKFPRVGVQTKIAIVSFVRETTPLPSEIVRLVFFSPHRRDDIFFFFFFFLFVLGSRK